MQPFAHALLETFATRRGALVEALSHIVHTNPHQEAGAIHPSDLEHLIDAVVVLLKEGLMREARGSEAPLRPGMGTEEAMGARFLQDILPDMLVGEGAAAGLMHVVAAWSAMLVSEIDRHIGNAYRDAARTWLADFAGAWIANVAKAAGEVGAPLQ